MAVMAMAEEDARHANNPTIYSMGWDLLSML
jgi:hypothetical protein